MGRWEEEQQAHQNWIQDIAEAKLHVRKALFEVERSDIDPGTVIIPNSSSKYEPMKHLHASVLDYHDQIKPIRNVAESLWQEPLTDVEYLGNREEISLSVLDGWRLRRIQIEQQTSDPVGGSGRETAEYRLWLPPSAAAACWSQINDVLDEVDLTVHLPEQSIDIMKHEPL